jgi:hypothetical protein
MLARTAHKGAHAVMCRQVRKQGCKARRGPQVCVGWAVKQGMFGHFIKVAAVAVGANGGGVVMQCRVL